MIDFSNLLWALSASKTYDSKNRNDTYSLQLYGSDKSIVRIDCRHDTYPDHSLLFGYVHGTVKINNGEATVLNQNLYLGSNLVIIPDQFSSINSFYINQTLRDKGIYTISVYQPAVQIIINPITNQPVVLGQESLNAIRNIVEDAI